MRESKLGHPELVKALIEHMRAEPLQAISFHDYMYVCLYHEKHGYYRSTDVKIGREGDFYTSSSIGTVMGEMLACYALKQWNSQEDSALSIIEWGGGNGRLALHILDELQRQEVACYNRITYTMIESSGFHRSLQQETLKRHDSRVRFVTEKEWMGESRQGESLVLANELLDAFPVHRIRFMNGQLEECFVSWDETSSLFFGNWQPLRNKEIAEYAASEIPEWQNGQIAEINLAAMDWVKAVAGRIGSGQLMIIDYGDNSDELYAAHRQLGTLMCYRKHQAYDNPYIYQGEQDMTAHVNFSSCIRAGLSGGFTGYKLATQREFVVEQGILTRLQEHFDPNPFSDKAKKNRTIRQLLWSDQMSELFKVLILTKKGDPM